MAGIGWRTNIPEMGNSLWSGIRSNGLMTSTIAGGVLGAAYGGLGENGSFGKALMGGMTGAGAGRYGYAGLGGARSSMEATRVWNDAFHQTGQYSKMSNGFMQAGKMASNSAYNQFRGDIRSTAERGVMAGMYLRSKLTRPVNPV